jgi:hypothetical protein
MNFQARSRPFSSSIICQAADKVTGAKFEENDPKKNPQGRPGHSVGGSGLDAPVDPEVCKSNLLALILVKLNLLALQLVQK